MSTTATRVARHFTSMKSPLFRGRYTDIPLKQLLFKHTQTAKYYVPNFKRNPDYASVTDTDVEKFKSFMCNPSTQVFTEFYDIKPFMTDWRNIFQATCLQNQNSDTKTAVLLPQNSHELSQILKYCNERKIAVVPQSGNTGLVGASTPMFDEVVVNVSKMNKIINFDPKSGVLECEAGCIVQNLNEFLNEQAPKYMLPYDLGSKGICKIGGNIGTNAGGLLMGRYGSMSGNVLGLEVVLANGETVDATSYLKKDNTGIKLHQMFIGAEGTLGIVTKVIIQCPLKPSSIQTCMFRCESFPKLLNAVMQFKRKMSDIQGKVEYFDHTTLQVCIDYLPHAKDIFNRPKDEILRGMFDWNHPNSNQHYLILETHGQNEETDKTRMKELVESFVDEGFVDDGVWAQTETHRKDMWVLREEIPLALSKFGPNIYFDFTLPHSDEMYDVVTEAKKIMNNPKEVLICGLGHLGDGNIHVLASFKNPEEFNKCSEELQVKLYEYMRMKGGSISAEHGIGVEKKDFMEGFRTPEFSNLAKSLKKTMDPNYILNPYKLY